MKDIKNITTKWFSVLGFVFVFFLWGGNAHAGQTVELALTADGNPVTEGMVVYCNEQTPPWNYASDSTGENGVYSFTLSAGSYRCSAYCDWTYWNNSCPYAGYPQTPTFTVGDSGEILAQSLDFEVKDKTIRVALTAGDEPLTSGMTVSCSQREEPWTGSSDSTSSDGFYECLVTEGNYYVSAYCNTWPCPYSGYPGTEVTVSAGDTMVDASLAFRLKDKTIRVSVLLGGESVTSGVSVSCYEMGGSWSSSYTDAPTSEGVYEVDVAAGKHSCSAYCTNWNDCELSGYPRVEVLLSDDDTTADATLEYLAGNATLSGIVTDGSSGLANVWVNINSYKISSDGAGSAMAARSGPRLKRATVTSIDDQTTQVYRSVQTDSNGAFQTRLPAGTYTVSVYPPYDRQDLASTSTEVTLSANGTTSVSLQMQRKTGVITGTVITADGEGVVAYINGWSANGSAGMGDWFWTQTDADGTYTVYAVEGYTYTISASPQWGTSNVCTYSNEGMQSVVASSSAQTVNFSFPTCDCSVTVNVVDSGGSIIPQISASVDFTPVSFADDDYYYGIWGWISAGTGTVQVEESRAYAVNLWFWDSDYTPGGEQQVTCADGSGSVDLTVLPVIENAVLGGYVTSDGTPVSLDRYTYLSVYATKDRTYRSCTTDASGYSCDLSEGAWVIGYYIDPSSGYASSPAGSSSSQVTVTAGSPVTRDLTLLSTGTVEVTVLDRDGSGRPHAWVEANPFAVSDEGGNDYQYRYCSQGCSTDDDGTCTISVGATAEGVTYYLNAYLPYSMRMDESLNNPEEQAVTVIAGQTVSATLSFSEPDGSVQLTLAEASASQTVPVSRRAARLKRVLNVGESGASPTALATVDCFSSGGGTFSVTSDENGSATCPCTTSHQWYAVAHNMVANALYLSDATEIDCTEEGATAVLTLELVATTPEGKSITLTDAATQSGSVELSDGFSVSFQPGALGGSGEQVTITVDIVVTPFMANRQPASFYAYSVSAFDADGVPITQLNSDATFTLPYNATQVENMGLTSDEIYSCYFDASTGAYSTIGNATVDDEVADSGGTPTISFTQSHLTDYVIVGNGLLGAIQGEEGGEIGIGDGEGGDDGGDDGGGSGSSASGGSGGCSLRP